MRRGLATSLAMKRILHAGGGVLAAGGIGFVAYRLVDYADELTITQLTAATWWWLAVLAGLYGIANLMLVAAWRDILEQSGAASSWRWALGIYGMSQIAKYVPGNVAHLAGRQAMGMAAGIPAEPLLKSSIAELALIASAGALFLVLLAPRVVPWLTGFPVFPLFALLAAAIVFILRRLRGPLAARAFCWYIVFLGASGYCFVAVLALLADGATTGPLSSLTICAAFVVAWLVGLITPGAPAGIGVRELAIVFFLGGAIADKDLVLAVAVGRGVTTLGDLGLFATAALLGRKEVSAS